MGRCCWCLTSQGGNAATKAPPVGCPKKSKHNNINMTIQNIAKIAKINIANRDEADFETSVFAVVSWVSKASLANTDFTTPMFHVTKPLTMEYRSDNTPVASTQQDLLANNKGATSGFFVTKLIVS